MTIHTYVTDSETLFKACKRFAQSPFIAVDTEFLRETTYYPKLCLVQLASEREVVLVDMLVDMDYTPLWHLLQNEQITKVIHAAHQDLECFYHTGGGCLPSPLFDTTVAAVLCGHQTNVGYAWLVKHYLGIELNKTLQRLTWDKRPLIPAACHYAANDVFYLAKLYPLLRELLLKQGRVEWMQEEMKWLLKEVKDNAEPTLAWKRFSIQRTALYKLAHWREITAQSLNIPRQHVLRDDALIRMIQKLPSVSFIHGWKPAPRPGWIEDITALCSVLEEEVISLTTVMPLKPGKQTILYCYLKTLLAHQAYLYSLPESWIASHLHLQGIIQGQPEVRCMTGWRYTVFGQQAEMLLQGKTALVVAQGEINLLPFAGSDIL